MFTCLEVSQEFIGDLREEVVGDIELVLSHFVALVFGGGMGALITLKFVKKQTINGAGNRIVDQSKSRAGGDIVGGDVNKK